MSEKSPESSRAERALSFGAAADAYERARPSYPDEIVDWLVPDGAQTALDLGAGTGKLTRSLAARGLEVTAVDPDVDMLDALRRSLPDVATDVGTAEAIPLTDRSIDLITVAQAWHWVDPPRAVAEAARVLRPGGRLALVWNIRDERDPWIRGLGDLIERSGAEMFLDRELELTAPFVEAESFWVDWFRELTREELLELVRSRSAWITRDAVGRAAMEADVERYLTENPSPAHPVPDDGGVRLSWAMPMRTIAYRATNGRAR